MDTLAHGQIRINEEGLLSSQWGKMSPADLVLPMRGELCPVFGEGLDVNTG